MATICGAFNNHVKEFFDDIKRVEPNDKDLIAAETAVEAARKVNATLFLKAWKKYTAPYHTQIMEKDRQFFLSKDYVEDVKSLEGNGALLDAIERIRKKVSTMDESHQVAIMGYVHNLTKLADLYIAK